MAPFASRLRLQPLSHKAPSPDKSDYRVRRERRWSTAGVYPPGNWFAPPGSNQSGSGGNETAEASGAEGRNGDLASVQAVTRVNAEQASKRLMQEPTRPDFGEGRSGWNGKSEQGSIRPAGVLATACRQRGPYATREVPAVIAVWINWRLVRDRPG